MPICFVNQNKNECFSLKVATSIIKDLIGFHIETQPRCSLMSGICVFFRAGKDTENRSLNNFYMRPYFMQDYWFNWPFNLDSISQTLKCRFSLDYHESTY